MRPRPDGIGRQHWRALMTMTMTMTRRGRMPIRRQPTVGVSRPDPFRQVADGPIGQL